MSAQTQYDFNLTKGYAGQVANIANSDIVTGIASATIVPGIFVKRTGAAESAPTTFNKAANYIVAPGGDNGGDNLGISVRDLGREGAPNTANIVYNAKDQLPVMRSGYIYCTIPTGGTAGTVVKFNRTTGVIDVGAAIAGEATIDGSRLEANVTAGGIGLVWIPDVITVTNGA